MKYNFVSVLCVSLLVSTCFTFQSAGEKIISQQSQVCLDIDIVDMVDMIDEDLVFYYFDNLMSYGARYTGSDNCTRAGLYIYDEFQNMGLDVEFHNWSFDGFKSSNIVATMNGTDSFRNAVFIMSAHYDCTQGSLGADDDGSGVAAMMAIAHVLSNHSFNHTICFIAFSGEEVGTYGSYFYARDAYNKGENIAAVLNLDMVGYASTDDGGRRMRIFQVDRSEWITDFAKKISEEYFDLLDMHVEGVPNYRGADHQAFLDYGYDAVFIAHYDGYSWANSPDDTPDHINHTYLVKATKYLLVLLVEIANKPIAIQVIIKNPKEGYFYFKNWSVFPLSFARFWYMGCRGTTILIGSPLVCVDVITDEEIKWVIFCIDEIFITWDSQPPYEWELQGKHYPLHGSHKLRVYAYTKSGDVASDEMDIWLFTRLFQYKKR
jgi:hypothetical protein